MNKNSTKLIYSVTFIVSFLVFLMLTFPFEVLKDTVSQKASELTGLDLTMESLSPNIPLGVNIEGLTVSRPGGKKIKIDEIDLDVSLLSLLTGKIGLSVEIEDGNGELELEVSIPISGILSNNPLPSYLELESDRFKLTEFINFGLDFYANSPGVNPLIGPMLKQVSVKTALSSKVKIDLDTSDPKSSDGSADIKFIGLTMASTDPSLGIPQQKFKTAQLVAKLNSGNFNLDPRSKFISDQLGLSFVGKIGLRNPIHRSSLAMDVGLDMSGEMKDNIGSLIAMLLLKTDATSWNGKATLQLSGTLASPGLNPLLEN
jgi:hypothetical protein